MIEKIDASNEMRRSKFQGIESGINFTGSCMSAYSTKDEH